MIATLSPNGQHLCAGAQPATRLLVATLDGVAILERPAPGGAWTERGRRLAGHHCSALLAASSGRVFAGMHSGGLFASDDGGETWSPSSRGITIDHVFTLAAVDGPDSETLYAGTQPVSLFRSRDDGASWTELPALAAMPGSEKWTFPPPPHHAHTKNLAFDPRDSRVVYAGIEQGALMKSRDGGASWRELDDYAKPEDRYYRDVHRIVIVPSRPDELFLTTGLGIYHSTDGGERWSRATDESFRIGYPDHLIVSPLDNDTLFLSGAAKDPFTWRSSHRAEGTIMRSRDGGRSWHDAGAGITTDGRANIEALSLAGCADGITLFAGTTDGEVWTSDDGAERWTLAARGLAPVSKVGHYRHLQLAPA
jgi:photosystem II stability/assembly factor-like uncharacterized protein